MLAAINMPFDRLAISLFFTVLEKLHWIDVVLLSDGLQI